LNEISIHEGITKVLIIPVPSNTLVQVRWTIFLIPALLARSSFVGCPPPTNHYAMKD
jgi:hypothetical protein